MESSKVQSFFQDIRSRELNGFRVRKRPYPDNDLSKSSEIGALAVEHDGNDTPPMAISFCKTSKNSHILSVANEDGYISLFNSRFKFPSLSTHHENTDKARICEWLAHDNSIFDVCWIKEDTRILTASGDQSIKTWDVQREVCVALLMGHTGSVKSICSHPTNSDCILSGSRDGSFALWDLRCSAGRNEKGLVTSHAVVKEAHISPHLKRVRRGKAASMSITSVLFLKDEISIATAGAVDSVVKFWDMRNLKGPVIQACPNFDSSNEKERGISSLSQDLNGVFMSASCRDNRIYLYNVLQLEKGPIKSFSGCRIDTFFVKSALSPDAAHLLGGSSDGNAYIWQVNKPEMEPVVLKGHDAEVTAVDWSLSEVGKIATSSDDFTVRLWNIENSCYSNTRSPSSIRRRVMPPSTKCRKLFADEATAVEICSRNSPDKVQHPMYSPTSITVSDVGTPESQRRKTSAGLNFDETLEKTPEATLKSPSSVLNPPSSLKRTIRDYFLAAS